MFFQNWSFLSNDVAWFEPNALIDHHVICMSGINGLIDWSNDQPRLVRWIPKHQPFYSAENNLKPLHASRVLAGHSLSPLRRRRLDGRSKTHAVALTKTGEGKLTLKLKFWSKIYESTSHLSSDQNLWLFLVYKGWQTTQLHIVIMS